MGNHLCCCLVKNREYIIEINEEDIEENIGLINSENLNKKKIYEEGYFSKFKKLVFKK